MGIIPIQQALDMARESLGCDAAIYVGDDDTDEDVFRMQPDWPLLAVRVRARGDTHAKFHLRGQREIDDLIERLVQLRLQADPAVARARSGQGPRLHP